MVSEGSLNVNLSKMSNHETTRVQKHFDGEGSVMETYK